MEENRKNNRKIFALIVGIATLMVSVTGSTFAYFALRATNDNVVTGTTATASLTLSVVEQELKSPNSGKIVPQLSTAIPTAINSTNKCVDGNGNIVCKVYKITVTNGSDAGALVNGTIVFTNYSTTNLRWRRIDSATTATTTTANTSYAASGVTVVKDAEVDLVSGKACVPSESTATCTDVSLAKSDGASGGSDESTYYIVVWLYETGSDQTSADAGKTFAATIKFEGADGKGITSTITS